MLASQGLDQPVRRPVTCLQINVTTRCNLACHHCHVESGPKRTEALGQAGVKRLLELLERNANVETVDLTGGAPELNPHFRELVEGARALGRRVIDRCNLTVLFLPGQQDTAAFLAAQGVDIVASLPCYTADAVDRQRGKRVFDRSIDALRMLNALSYGTGLAGAPTLDLVYNPIGATLPPAQDALEAEYRVELRERFGITFDSLIAITNMPIKRFATDLARSGRAAEYMALLVNHFNASNLEGLMCRELVSVDHAGRLYDCDFNQALGTLLSGEKRTIWEIDDLGDLEGRQIATGPHCFGCTAGAGSSCAGALS